MNTKLSFVLLASLLLTACPGGPGGDSWTELCGEVDCGPGRCVVDGDQAACVCDEGHLPQGLACVKQELSDPCDPNPCLDSGRTRCEADGAAARCLCDAGLHEVGGECLESSVCVPNPCAAPFQTVCEADGTNARCLCDPGHAPAGDGCEPIPVFDCSVEQAGGDTFEPDECPDRATLLLVDGPAIVGHSVQPAGDVDWFALEAQPGRLYQFQASGGLALYADVYDTDGLTPLAADHRGGTSVEVSFRSPGTQRVFLRLRALQAQATGDYEVGVADLGLDDFSDETASALAIAAEATVEGRLQFVGDLDVLRIDRLGGVSQSVSLSWLGSGIASLELIGADGVTVERRLSGRTLKLITRSAQTAPAWLRISAPLEGDWRLETEIIGEDDHGDVPEEATHVLADGAPFSVALERVADLDVVYVEAEADRIYGFECTQPEPLCPVSLDAFASNYILAQVSNGGLKLEAEARADGPLYFRVRASVYASCSETGFACRVTDLGADDHGDDRAHATPIVADGTQVSGMLARADDVDVFSFAAEAGQGCRILRIASSPPLELVLTDDRGTRLASGSTVVAAQLAAAGTYFVEVRTHTTTTGSYAFSLDEFGGDEHGDDLGSATPIAPGDSGLSAIDWPSDKDVFAFQASADHVYSFLCTGIGGTWCVLRMLDSSGEVWASQSSSGTAFVVHSPPQSRTVFVEVGATQGRLGAYSFELSDLGRDDHGDDVASATPIAPGDTGTAVFEHDRDCDAFQFTPVAGRIYRFSVGRPFTHCLITVVDLLGSPVAASSSGCEATYEAPTSAPLTALVAASVAGAASYSWALVDLGTDDHGDDFASATLLTAPVGLTAAAIDHPDDKDVFRIEAIAGRGYELSCSVLSSCVVRAFDPSGLAVTVPYRAVASFEAGQSGPFFFVVETSSQAVGAYSFHLAEFPADDHPDDIVGATALSVGAAAGAGVIEHCGDQDVFAFTPSAGRIYRARCHWSNASSCMLSFLDARGFIVANGPTSIAWRTASDEPAYLAVSADFSGAYSVSLEDLGLDDHGDSHLDATPIAVGVSVTGALEWIGDLDYFAVTVAAGSVHEITVSGTDAHVDVFEPDGTTWLGGNGFTATAAGTYFIRVFTFSQLGSAYTLRVL